MHFDCLHCQQRLAIEDDRAGESLTCPTCGQRICVPPAPSVIYKGRRNTGGIRLVPILPKGSLARHMAALRAAQRTPEPMYL